MTPSRASNPPRVSVSALRIDEAGVEEGDRGGGHARGISERSLRLQAGGLSSSLRQLDVPFRQEGADQRRGFVDFLVEGKMAGLEDMDVRVRNIPLIGLRPGQRERRIVSAPQHKQRRAMRFQPGLP